MIGWWFWLACQCCTPESPGHALPIEDVPTSTGAPSPTGDTAAVSPTGDTGPTPLWPVSFTVDDAHATFAERVDDPEAKDAGRSAHFVDLDHDGTLEVVTHGRRNAFSWSIPVAGGLHTTDAAVRTMGVGSHGLCAKDLDGDGFTDIVTFDSRWAAEDRVRIEFTPMGRGHVDITTPAEGVPCVGDVDGDGFPDVVTHTLTALHIYRGPWVIGSDRTAPDAVVPLPEDVHHIQCGADLTADGVADVLTWNRPSGTMRVVPGPLIGPGFLLASSGALNPGHVTGDGQLVLRTVDPTTASDVVLWWALPLADGTSPVERARRTLASGDIVTWSASALGDVDLDNDGVRDLIVGWGTWPSFELRGYFGPFDGDGTMETMVPDITWPLGQLPLGWDAADIDGNGMMDLLVAEVPPSGGVVRLYLTPEREP